MMWLLPKDNVLVGLQGKILKSDNHVNGIVWQSEGRDKLAEYTLVFSVKKFQARGPQNHLLTCKKFLSCFSNFKF